MASIDHGENLFVHVDELRPGSSPRLGGEDAAHILALAATESDFPPILVHRPTMRVIDGMHRWRAAQRRGQESIRVRFVDGNETDLLVIAVRANITHGLPLPAADRESAALRIMASQPAWSDRAIAETTGLSASTVRSLRCSTAHVNRRIGRDGRVRPLDASEGRRRAGEIIASRPDATVREIAATAGISIGTASDVCRRVRAGLDPVLQRRSGPQESGPQSAGATRLEPVPAAVRRQPSGVSWLDVRKNMSNDPSIRFATTGRELLRWLDSHAFDRSEWDELAGALPLHWADTVADQMLDWAESWRQLADSIRGTNVIAG